MRGICVMIPLYVLVLAAGGFACAQEGKAPLKLKPSKTVEKVPAVQVIDVGADGLKIEALRLVESTTACEWRYEITVRNNGMKGFTGTIGLSPALIGGADQGPCGSNVLNIKDLGPGKTHTEVKPITLEPNPFFTGLSVRLTKGSKTVDTKTLALNLHYTGLIASASVESGMVRVAVKSTSAVAARFHFNLYKPDTSAPSGWASAGGKGLCLSPGQTYTESVAVPQGWPSDPKTLKVVLKSGSNVLGEKLISAPPQ